MAHAGRVDDPAGDGLPTIRFPAEGGATTHPSLPMADRVRVPLRQQRTGNVVRQIPNQLYRAVPKKNAGVELQRVNVEDFESLATKVLGAIALERVTTRKADPSRLHELR